MQNGCHDPCGFIQLYGASIFFKRLGGGLIGISVQLQWTCWLASGYLLVDI